MFLLVSLRHVGAHQGEHRVGEELGFQGNEVALRTVLVTLGHDHSSWVKM